MKWYQRAKIKMKQQGIKQDDLIAPLNVKTRGAVGHYLSGRREPTQEQLIALSKKINCSIEWLLKGVDIYSTNDTTKQSTINNAAQVNHEKTAYNIPIRHLKYTAWHNLAIFLNSDNKDKEFNIMPTTDIEVSDHAFMIKIDHNNYENYVTVGDTIIIDPKAPLLQGHKILITIKGQPHIVHYELLDKEYITPLRKNATPIPITPELDCKIIGPLIWIMPKGRKA